MVGPKDIKQALEELGFEEYTKQLEGKELQLLRQKDKLLKVDVKGEPLEA